MTYTSYVATVPRPGARLGMVRLALTLVVTLLACHASTSLARSQEPAPGWTPIAVAGAPAPRFGHAAVWTGSEMIVFGGSGGPDPRNASPLRDGGRYRPGAGWNPLPTDGAPGAMLTPTAVWTGREMIAWGATRDSTENPVGGAFDPLTNTWSRLPRDGAPTARDWHTAVWTGTEMIIWGGTTGTDQADGGRYDPVSRTWAPLPTASAPSPRFWHTAVWTGTEMLVWGGTSVRGSGPLGDGARFNPATNIWTLLPTAGAPSPRSRHSAVWTGSEMIVWGGSDLGRQFDDGARYSPDTDTWTRLETDGAPAPRSEHTAVWTGTEMIVWGGEFADADGSRYNPAANTWASFPREVVPSARARHTAVWSGTDMIVWGGLSVRERSRLNDGARYAPLWLIPSAPVQVYSITDDPLWIAQPGERNRVVRREDSWALAIWEGDGPRWSVWIPVDGEVDVGPL